jgi:hypothetical protein
MGNLSVPSPGKWILDMFGRNLFRTFFWILESKIPACFEKKGSQVAAQRGLDGSSPAPRLQPKGSTLKSIGKYKEKNLKTYKAIMDRRRRCDVATNLGLPGPSPITPRDRIPREGPAHLDHPDHKQYLYPCNFPIKPIHIYIYIYIYTYNHIQQIISIYTWPCPCWIQAPFSAGGKIGSSFFLFNLGTDCWSKSRLKR